MAYRWEKVLLLDDDHDGDDDVDTLLRTSRGAGQNQARSSREHRRSNRHVEDGYGDSDWA